MNDSKNEGEWLLTAEDVAARLRVNVRTVWTYKKDGTLPPFVPLKGNRVRWRASDIDAWIKARQEGADQ